MTAATLVNLRFTFATEQPRIGVLPMLLGQNGPGTAMGICVCLAAWLAVSTNTAASAFLAMVAAGPAVFGAAISYSKIGMSGASLGIASLIAAVIGREPGTVRRALRTASVLIVVTMVALAIAPNGIEAFDSLRVFANKKLATVSPDAIAATSSDGESSVGARLGYVVGTLEIMVAHPIGVGYSGFSAAIQKTRAHQSGQVPSEIGVEDAAGSSNPHSTALYYASAGGWIGLGLCVAAFLALLQCIMKGVGSFGAAGRFVALASCLAFVVAFISVPTLLRTKLLIASAGIAVASAQLSKQHAHRAKA
ncbi:MAG: O-antigen ligase family protein [Phycisphaerales bacterium]